MEKTEVAIIGGGPGGYMAALALAKMGTKPIIFERDNLGGTCLNAGCIPTKALLTSAGIIEKAKSTADFGVKCTLQTDYAAAAKRKDRVVSRNVLGLKSTLEKSGITIIPYEAKICDQNVIEAGGKQYAAEKLIIATGSKPKIPPIQGIEHALDSTRALALKNVPDKVAIIGGGVIGAEFARIYHAFGAKVVIVEALDKMLTGFDDEISAAIKKSFVAKGIKVYTSSLVDRISKTDKGLDITIKTPGGIEIIDTDMCVYATGREAVLPEGLENYNIEMNRGFICVNEHMQTSVPGIYAVGDCTGISMLAHTAFKQGTVAAENCLGANSTMDYSFIPSCVYTSPEIASAGQTSLQAEKSDDAKYSIYNVFQNSRALAEGEREGFVKLVAKADGTVLGVHLFMPHATEIISFIAALIKTGAKVNDIKNAVFAHPTYSESVWDCANAL